MATDVRFGVTPSLQVSSTSGTTRAGLRALSISNTGSAAAVVAGASLPAGASVSWAPPEGAVLRSVSFDATGTTLLIAGLS